MSALFPKRGTSDICFLYYMIILCEGALPQKGNIKTGKRTIQRVYTVVQG